MRTRVFVCALSAATAAGSLAAVVSAQDVASSDSYDTPLTPWGDPDLQGVWDYRNITPLQRPDDVDGEFFTDEEAAEREDAAARRMDEAPEEVRGGLVHAQYWTDPGRYLDESGRTSLIIDPPDGQIPDLTPEAQAREAAERESGGGFGRGADSYLDRTLMERCITQGFPRAIMPTLYNNNIEIVQSPGHVAIVHEMIHETRIVPLDGSDFSGFRNYMGESRGHWEGDTLVVETRNFNDQVSYQGSSENLKITERYTRVAPDRIAFSMTFEDDTHWVTPWTVAYTMRPTDGDLFEYACHEGNYGLTNILQYARDAEAAQAEASGD